MSNLGLNPIEELYLYFGKRLSIQQIMNVISMSRFLEKVEWETCSVFGNSNLEFYSHSRFFMFSVVMDEMERNRDIDWKVMREQLSAYHGIKILDYGAGIGSAGLQLVDRENHLHFFEPNDYMRRFLEWRVLQNGISDSIVVGERAELLDEQYDLIVSWGVFEHLSENEVEQTLDWMVNHLTGAGKIYLKTWYSWEEEKELFAMHFSLSDRLREIYSRFQARIIWYNNTPMN